jgi:hypothetical protein
MSLVSLNIINYCKISQFLVKFCKSPKDLRKILLKWLGICSYTEKWLKVGQLSSKTLTKVYGIPQWFYHSQTFSFIEISSCFVSFMTKIFHFMKILELPTFLQTNCVRHYQTFVFLINPFLYKLERSWAESEEWSPFQCHSEILGLTESVGQCKTA